MGGFIIILILGVFAIFAAGGSMIYVLIWWGTMFLFVYWIYRLCVRYDKRQYKAYLEQQAKINEARKSKEALRQELIIKMRELGQEQLEIEIKQKQMIEKIEKLTPHERPPVSPDELDNFFKSTDKELRRIADEKLELERKYYDIKIW